MAARNLSSGLRAEPAASPRILTRADFARPALTVARDLIGKYLVRKIGGQTVAAMITETEAYTGPNDRACHAHRGRTARTEVMFGPAGIWYVYFIYGMHWMLNVVTDDEEHPAAVLFRGAGEWIGPGRLTRSLQIDRTLNGTPAAPASGLWIEDRGIAIPRRRIERTPRIGVAYAAEWAEKLYRFALTPATPPGAAGRPPRIAKTRLKPNSENGRRSRSFTV